ncbi:MAG: RNA methyltransferase [Parachlamydiales bacterium]|jgi:TrmH family RNA methyltransferase
MDNDLTITSNQNPRVKGVVKLRNRSERDEKNLFLIEGYRELLRAVDSQWGISTLYYCPELFLGTNEPTLIDTIRKKGTAIFRCSKEVFTKMAYRDRPDGLLAEAPQRHPTLSSLSKHASPLYLIAEAIEKPGNLGTILRSADAVGATAVIVCDRCTDIYNPNVVRASVGTLFTIPVIETTSAEAIAWLRENKIAILAATPSANTLFTHADMKQPLAIAVGTEQLGLSPLWMQQADLQVAIPMCGVADSLNVATATTLLLYEALRQRGA